MSAVYESVQAVTEALEIVDQYILEKEILDGDNPNRDKGSGGCFVCGSEEHRAFACPNRARLSKKEKDIKVTFNAKAVEQRQKRHKVDSD